MYCCLAVLLLSCQLDEELSTQKAISESTCEELLALSASHSDIKQAYFKLEAESKQHDQLVHIVQQELAEMSYFAAAGRVALGLCQPDEAHFTSGAVVVTPTHSGTESTQTFSQQQSQLAAASATEAQHGGDGLQNGSSSIHRHSSRLIEDTTAVCIAAAAAAGAAAAVGASPRSPRSVSSSRTMTPRRMSKPAADLLATQAAAPSAAAAKEATMTAAGDSSAAEAVEAAVLAAAVAAARVTLDAEEKAGQACNSNTTSTICETQQQPADLEDSALLGSDGECVGGITAANSAAQLQSEVASVTLSEGVGCEEGCAESAGQQGRMGAGGEAVPSGRQGRKDRRRRRRAGHKKKEQEGAAA